MKKIYTLLLTALVFCGATSCESFINDIPKGQKIPTTWADYEAFIRNSGTYHYFEQDQMYLLMGEFFKVPNTVSSASLSRTHYFFEEDVDRTQLPSDKNPYYSAYEGIFAWNLIVDDGPNLTECTPQQRDELVAQARVLRVMHYHYLAAYYAQPYSEANKHLLSVPLVTSASVEAPSPQVTLEELYQFMIEDLLLAVEDLPERGASLLHPGKALGYGMLARVYLSMSDYTNALLYAEKALAQNSALYNWVDFYFADQERFDGPSYVTGPLSNPEMDNPETYIYRYGSMTGWNGLNNTSYALPECRALQFEPGDTRLICRWKRRVSASGLVYYAGIYAVEQNKGGMCAAEMYYIKAECLARSGKTQEAMDVVNAVRKTRILPEFYQPLAPGTVEETVNKVLDCKFNEHVQTIVSFIDMRRINTTAEYARQIVNVVQNGAVEDTYLLQPNSHLWTMPFPAEVLTNPGNNPIVQNVSK